MTPSEILKKLSSYPCRHLVVTGGEPSLQLDDLLVDLLHEEGFFIQVETNGTAPLPAGIDWVTCSPKSTEAGIAEVRVKTIDELKVVYTGQDVEKIAESISPAPMHFFLQPCSSKRYPTGSNTRETVDYILAHPHWRLSLQTHKLIDIP